MGKKAFICKNCGKRVFEVKYGGYQRNHCPDCLFSLHVDLAAPGDRKNKCQGLMKPTSFFRRRTGEQVIVHRCLRCGKEIFNRIAADDDIDKVDLLPEVEPRKGG